MTRKVIGITGGIGSGKSIVSRILRCKGYKVYDCDSRAKTLMDSSQHLCNLIAQELGDECVTAEGLLNRKVIASIVFGNSEKLLWLNAQVHGLVRQDIEDWIANSSETLLFVESAILKSSGLWEMCDEIWLVDAPISLSLQRACGRDKSEEEHVLKRMEAQKHEFDGFGMKIVHVIKNGTDDELLEQLIELIEY